jgi:hypothetical protein
MELNLKKSDFSKAKLVYLGYVVGGGEYKIDPKVLAIVI